jgi:uncharacterized membrane protein YdjX (TVP38/TMEM64 family)
VAAVVAVAAVLGLAWRLGLFAELAEPRRFADAVVAMGPWAWFGFVVAYAVLQPFGVPGTVFIVAAPLLWPWPLAFGLSMAGTMAASLIGFSFARWVARDWVSARIPARLRRYEAALERSAFLTVFSLRLLLWMPQVLHFFLGVSKVPFWTHFWGSLLGYVPPLLLVSYLGATLFDASGKLQPEAWVSLAALVAGSLVLIAALRRFEQRRAWAGAPGDVSAAARTVAAGADGAGRRRRHRPSEGPRP